MSIDIVRKLPSSKDVKKVMPLNGKVKEIKEKRDKEIEKIFKGELDKFVLIIGPCSADDEEAVIEYVKKLGKLQDKYEDKLMIIPRIYTNKPRTTGEGYKGLLHQPNPNEKPNMLEGIEAIRRLHINVIKESGLTSADEMLYPTNYEYLSDVLSYIAVGARSVENQKHRLVASGIEHPVGMKNPTSGDLTVMLNSIKASQIQHSLIFNGNEVKTTGNELSHCILRGYVDQYGRNFPNYHYEEVKHLVSNYNDRDLVNQSIIIDTSHANSNKQYLEQPRIAMEVLRNRNYDSELKDVIKGLMIESYLKEGKQAEVGKEFGKSITDPCLGWEQTEKLVENIYNEL
ncbi:MAG: 3-deoxy-7-phosphoheptulonate synthase [Bacillota bacterium]